MDTDADFVAYVKARWDPLVRSAVLLGCSHAEAEDIVQVALLRCYQVWHRVRRVDVPDAYVYRVLVNCLAKSRRRRWWGETPTVLLLDEQVDDPADEATSRTAVGAALAGLTQPHREVVVLRYFADLSERQVADVLGIPAGTVKSRLSRGLARLAEQLGDVEIRRDEETSC